MVYTEVLQRKRKKYYYRVQSIRKGKKVVKKRKYLGVNLKKNEIKEAEQKADIDLQLLCSLLTNEELKELDGIKQQFSTEPQETFDNRYETFVSLFTYDSNAIEGNTLTLQETSQLLFDSIVPRKSLREINEALNHKKAFDKILEYYKGDITKDFIHELHELVVKETLRKDLESQIGTYRTVQVYIRGVEWLPPKPAGVPKEMASLLSWYTRNKDTLHPLIVASYFHTAFERIHPFIDGNGRVGRLLMNFILHKNKFPMITISYKIKRKYYEALAEAQQKGNLRSFVKFVFNVLKESKIKF